MDIKYYYENTELTLQQIADKTGSTYKRVFNYVHKHYSSAYRKARKSVTYRNSRLGDKNPSHGLRGVSSRRYIGDVSDNKGYLMRLKPDWYTGRAKSKHVFVHSIVACEALGITEIPAGWCVHHVDGNPHNNSFDNLVVCTLGDHMSIHAHIRAGATTISKESTLKWVEAHGTPFVRDDMVCSA